MLKPILALVLSVIAMLLIGPRVLPVLRKLKFGQTMYELGPQSHMVKQGTPTMGGLMFMAAALICVLAAGWMAMLAGTYEHLMVLGFSLIYGAIGFLDDFVKVKMKRNLGLTSLQKLILQLAVALAYLALLRWNGNLTSELYIPFVNVSLQLPWVLYLFFAVFVIVGCVNAVNLTDGVDGLASGRQFIENGYIQITVDHQCQCSGNGGG